MGRPVGDPTNNSGRPGDAMANNATQLSDTYAPHGNEPRKYEMATTSNKFGCRRGSDDIYIPPNATTQRTTPSKLRTNTQNIVEPLAFGTRGL